MPPLALTDAEPPDEQVPSLLLQDTLNAVGSVIVTEVVDVQLFASVTVNV